jgi:hypothetical protein
MCQPRITSAAISTGYTAQLSPYFVYGDITNAQISTNKDKPTGVIKLGFNRLYSLISIFFFVYLTLPTARVAKWRAFWNKKA